MLDNVTITSLVTCDCWSTESGYRGLSDVSFGRPDGSFFYGDCSGFMAVLIDIIVPVTQVIGLPRVVERVGRPAEARGSKPGPGGRRFNFESNTVESVLK